ncbi:hypothetical protein IWX90DRAFT_66595 [Phyllosticta citrichinensis]|uniref:Uncharacterized protein n=1 Tax=Phyllosticta citrichinensis TaxID=1130410 RepID=A0ABR1XHU8_9PEZI
MRAPSLAATHLPTQVRPQRATKAREMTRARPRTTHRLAAASVRRVRGYFNPLLALLALPGLRLVVGVSGPAGADAHAAVDGSCGWVIRGLELRRSSVVRSCFACQKESRSGKGIRVRVGGGVNSHRPTTDEVPGLKRSGLVGSRARGLAGPVCPSELESIVG